VINIMLGEVNAIWDYDDETWEADDAFVRELLQTWYDGLVAPDLGPRDILMDDGVSGKVWKELKEVFGKRVELIELIPEPKPEIEEVGGPLL